MCTEDLSCGTLGAVQDYMCTEDLSFGTLGTKGRVVAKSHRGSDH